jgi:hypothetical protein
LGLIALGTLARLVTAFVAYGMDADIREHRYGTRGACCAVRVAT